MSPVMATREKITLGSIVTGVKCPPPRIFLWGLPGVGKTTWSAGAPAPIFACAEEGAEQLGAARVEINTWLDFLDMIVMLKNEAHPYKTLVIDSARPLESFLWDYLCSTHGWKNIDSPDYGKGYAAATKEWIQVLKDLDALRRAKGMGLIMIGHSAEKEANNPELDVAYRRFEVKLHRSAWDTIRAWCDGVFFAKYEAFVKGTGSKARGFSTGVRELCTQWSAVYDAKSRWSMPAKISLDYSEFAQYLNGEVLPDEVVQLKDQLLEVGAPLIGTKLESKRDAAIAFAGDDPVKLRRAVGILQGYAQRVINERQAQQQQEEEKEG